MENTKSTLTQFSEIRIGILICLLGTVFYRGMFIDAKHALDYDEAISYLAAACRQVDYHTVSKPFELQSVSSWQAYFEPAEPFCFGKIQEGLATADIHPPLYFWLLHIWVLAIGMHVESGITLNVLLGALTASVAYATARLVFRSKKIALLTMASYVFNPSVLLVTNEARQYDLFALWTMLAMWAMIYAYRKQAWKDIVLIGIVITAGFLTHYQFIFVCFGLLIFSAGHYLKTRQRIDFGIMVGIVTGFLTAYVIHPYFLATFQRRSNQVVEFNLADFWERFNKIIVSLVTVYYSAIGIIVVLLIGFVMYWGWRKQFDRFVKRVTIDMWLVLWMLCCLLGALSAMYLAFITPAHAMGPPKYLSMVWGLFAFLPGILLRLWDGRLSLLLYLVLVPVVYVVLFPVLIRPLKAFNQPSELTDASLILVDNRQRGVFFQIVWLLPDDAVILSANQQELLDNPDAWVPLLCSQTFYASDTFTPNSKMQQDEILQVFEGQNYQITPIPRGIRSNSSQFDLFMMSQPDAAGQCLQEKSDVIRP